MQWLFILGESWFIHNSEGRDIIAQGQCEGAASSHPAAVALGLFEGYWSCDVQNEEEEVLWGSFLPTA